MAQTIYTYSELDGTMVITYQDKETGEITKTMKYKDGVAKVVYEKPMSEGKVEEIHARMKQSIENIGADLDKLLKTQRTQEINVYVNKAVDVLFDVLLQNKMVDTEKFKKEDFHRLFVSPLNEEKASEQGLMTVGQIFESWVRGKHPIVDNSILVWEWHNKQLQF